MCLLHVLPEIACLNSMHTGIGCICLEFYHIAYLLIGCGGILLGWGGWGGDGDEEDHQDLWEGGLEKQER